MPSTLNRITSRLLVALSALVAAGTLSACDDARVEYIRATPDVIERGEYSHVEWKVWNGENCQLDVEPGEPRYHVDAHSDLWVSPDVSTVYTISCDSKDLGKKATESVALGVDDPQIHILAFTASPDTVDSGDNVALLWDVENADACEINPGAIEAVPPLGVAIVNPSATAVYTLSCTQESLPDPATSPVVVTVNP